MVLIVWCLCVCARFVLVTVMLCAVVKPIVCTNTVYTMLVGWTGDGKSFFCDRFDGTRCQASDVVYVPEQSTTNSSYVGYHFIDTVGFGDNRKLSPTLDDSLAALNNTLHATDERALATKMSQYRELECEALPGRLVSIRANSNELLGTIKDESSIPMCVRDQCTLAPVSLASCTRTYCARTAVA